MKELLDRIKDKILIVDVEGKIEFCNQSLLERLQDKLSSFKGRKLNRFLVLGDKNFIGWEELIKSGTTQFCISLMNIYNQEIGFEGELSKGEWLGKSAYYIILTERNLLYNVTELEKLLDKLPFIVWCKDKDKRYRFVNECFINKISKLAENIERGSILGKTDKDIWNDEIAQIIQEGENELILKKEAICYERAIELEDRKRWYQFNFIPIKGDAGEIEYILGMREEVTLRKKMELQLDKSYYKKYMETKLYTQDIQIKDEHIQYLYQMPGINSNIQEVLGEIGAEGIIIGIYNKDKNSLCCTYKQGMKRCTLKPLDEIKLIGDFSNETINKSHIWGIKTAEEYYGFIDDEQRKEFKIEDLSYLGCYPIALEEELLGILICSYTGIDSINPSKETQVFRISKQIALMIQNEVLTKAVKSELERREELEIELQNFAETASDLMAIIRTDGRIDKASGAWESILGWKPSELEGHLTNEFVYMEDQQRFAEKQFDITNTKAVRGIICRSRCKSKGYKWIEWSIRYASSRQCYICTGRDISKEREQEEAKKVYEEALQVEKIKSEFFANMSHEFRTPLNIILATVQLLEKGVKQGYINTESGFNLDKCVGSIKQNTYRILRLANNIMELTSIDTGHYKMKLENLNIINVIEETTLSVADYIESRGLTLLFDTEVEEVITACDAEKLERIILNILSNSVKYTLRGGTISVNLSVQDESLIVKITDTGVGIPKEKLDTIFNPFIQVDSLLTRKCEGSGIGLALVKSLVEMHEGTIKANSVVSKGTEIIIRFPIREMQDSNEAEPIEFEPRIEQTKVEFSDIYNLY